jgi:hypothetical protein
LNTIKGTHTISLIFEPEDICGWLYIIFIIGFALWERIFCDAFGKVPEPLIKVSTSGKAKKSGRGRKIVRQGRVP